MNPVITAASHGSRQTSRCKAFHPGWTKQRGGCMSWAWPLIFHPFERSRAAHPANHKHQPVEMQKPVRHFLWGAAAWGGCLVKPLNICIYLFISLEKVWASLFSWNRGSAGKQRKLWSGVTDTTCFCSGSVSQWVILSPAAGDVRLINDPGQRSMKLRWSLQEAEG